jgi:threonine/homoserine/homoserine lactone efflux protein
MGAGYAAAVVWTFLPIAVLLTLAPGPATAMVVRNALRDGWRAAFLTVAGNEVGVVTWALLSVLGISALVAASEVAYVALKLVGACVLIWIGVQSLRRSGEPAEARRSSTRPFRDWYTSLAVMVSRARQTFVRSRVGRWVERTTGAILIALGVRVAIEQR